jgi:hypothetical protein
MSIGLHVKYPLFLSDFRKILISDFMKINTELLLGISGVVTTQVNTGKPRQFALQDRTVFP